MSGPKKHNLIGKVFSKLTVIGEADRVGNGKRKKVAWLCECSCAEKTRLVVSAPSLLSENTRSCGCFDSKELTGKVFDRLTVISRAAPIINGKGHKKAAWLCQCLCGKQKVIEQQNLVSGNSTSCGCFRDEMIKINIQKRQRDLVGETFGRLLVVARSFRFGSNNISSWLCQCSCGTNKVIEQQHLVTGNTKSCGCLLDEFYHGDKYIKNRVEANARSVFYGYSKEFDTITFDQFLAISQMSCDYCGVLPKQIRKTRDPAPGNEFIYNGLDRVDNDKPHIVGNCVPCCWPCNWAKGDLERAEYLNWIDRTYNWFIYGIDKNMNVRVRSYKRVYAILLGRMFGRLTVIKETVINPINGAICCLCQCVCGATKMVKRGYLTSGKTTSCGCYAKEMSTKMCAIMNSNKIRTPKVILAARAAYNHSYTDGNLSFDDFMNMSQLNCHYCNLPPNNTGANGIFIYSGLDRVDNTRVHDLDNCVSCCIQCNKSKSDMSIDEFRAWLIASYKCSILYVNNNV